MSNESMANGVTECDPVQECLKEIQKLQKEIDELKKITQENKKLREALEFYTHEKYREGYSVTGIMQGHRYDIACGACNEENKGRLARKTLKEIDEAK